MSELESPPRVRHQAGVGVLTNPFQAFAACACGWTGPDRETREVTDEDVRAALSKRSRAAMPSGEEERWMRAVLTEFAKRGER